MSTEAYVFRKSTLSDAPAIWIILQDAIERRRLDGSQQWQDGYPNVETIEADIQKNIGYILEIHGKIAGYAAVILNDEPAYDKIEGQWLTNGDFLVVHRLAVSEDFFRKGIAKLIFENIEKLALEKNIPSIKVDTNFDNAAMLHILERRGFTYCGEVQLRGGKRKAFEKVL